MFSINIDPENCSRATLKSVANMLNELAGEKSEKKDPPMGQPAMAGKTPVVTPAHGPEFPVEAKGDDDVVYIDAAPSADFDSAGLPWDERIHSSSKKQNNDGTWKARRGVDKEVRQAVEAELKAGMGATTEPSAYRDDPTENTQDPAKVFGGQQPQQQVAEQPQQQVAEQPQQQVAVPSDMKWPEFLNKLVTARAAGTLDQAKLDEMMKDDGIKGGIPLLAHRSDLWSRYLQELAL